MRAPCEASESLHGEVRLDALEIGEQIGSESHGPGLTADNPNDFGTGNPAGPVPVAAVVDVECLLAAAMTATQGLGVGGITPHEALDGRDPTLTPRGLGDGAGDFLAGLDGIEHGVILDRTNLTPGLPGLSGPLNQRDLPRSGALMIVTAASPEQQHRGLGSRLGARGSVRTRLLHWLHDRSE